MTMDSVAMKAFVEAYMEYLDGDRDTPPAIEELQDLDRRAAERWLKSLREGRGISPYASRPSASELLARVDARRKAITENTVQTALERGLQDSLDGGTFALPDVAGVAAGVESHFVIHVRGLRIRVVLEPGGKELAAAFRDRLGDVAEIFDAFPETDAVLIATTDPKPQGAVVDRYDAEWAIETPSGRQGSPRLDGEIGNAVAACARFVNTTMPSFESFRCVPTMVPGRLGDLLDVGRISEEAIRGVVASGRRAQLEAKRRTWSALGERERALVSDLLLDTLSRPVGEEEYRKRLTAADEAA